MEWHIICDSCWETRYPGQEAGQVAHISSDEASSDIADRSCCYCSEPLGKNVYKIIHQDKELLNCNAEECQMSDLELKLRKQEKDRKEQKAKKPKAGEAKDNHGPLPELNLNRKGELELDFSTQESGIAVAALDLAFALLHAKMDVSKNALKALGALAEKYPEAVKALNIKGRQMGVHADEVLEEHTELSARG